MVCDASSGADVTQAGVENVEGVGGGEILGDISEVVDSDTKEKAEDVEGHFECDARMIDCRGSSESCSSTENVVELTIGLITIVGLESFTAFGSEQTLVTAAWE